MGRRNHTSILIDSLLRTVAVGGFTVASITLPGTAQLLDKPLRRFAKQLDKRQRQRELQRLLRYARQAKLVTESYKHGLQLTEKARNRLEKVDIDQLEIPNQQNWDKTWRIVIYDIPESYKRGRDSLSSKLRQLSFYQLQRSVWVHPFPCTKEIAMIAASYSIERFVTIIQATSLNDEHKLKKKFADLI